MKSKAANVVPLCVTGAVLLLAVGFHFLSRTLSEKAGEAPAASHSGAALIAVEAITYPEQIEALTYDARVKLGASLNDPNYVARNMATVFFDDVAVQQVNDGSLSHQYAPAVDEESAHKLYPRMWPWPRFIHGQIVRELAAEGATAAGFDIIFPETGERREEEFVTLPEGRVSSDEFFALEMRKAGNTYLAVEQEDTVPPPLFLTNSAGLASIRSHSDYAVLRRVKPFNDVRVWHPLIRDREKALDLDLSHAVVANHKLTIPNRVRVPDASPLEIPLTSGGKMRLGSDGDIDFDDSSTSTNEVPPFQIEHAWNLGLTLAARALGLDLQHPEILSDRIVLHGPKGLTRSIPIDRGGYFYIDWSIRLDDVKSGRTPVYFGHLGELLTNDKFRAQGDTNEANHFKGKIVLIGSIATGNNMSDIGATPLQAQTPLVTKHLNIANSILTGRFVERTSIWAEALLIIVLGVLSALLTWRMRVLVAAIGVAGLCAAYIIFTVWMYLDYRYWIPIVMPVGGGLILPHFSLLTYRVMFEQKEQRRVRSIFSKIVSPDVVQELLSAEKLALGGARRKITVYFADVRGFTEFTDSTQGTAEDFVRKSNLSEEESRVYFDRVAAEQLATVNLYLAIIADTIKAHRGTLDKYMGDCVMAFWGSPTPNEQHALCCLRAAIDAQRALYELNQKRFAENERRKKENASAAAEGKAPVPLLPLLSLGSGINTGYATVGLMGSDATILNYTVFGREVNLASRLEGASGRGRILISDATFQEIQRDDPALAASCIAQAPITPKGFRNASRTDEVPWKSAAISAAQAPAQAEPEKLSVATPAL
jgi:class 3 adenylate cyclase/CHASE2 domain-containing sensor protein